MNERQNPDGSWGPAEPVKSGPFFRFEMWLRANGFKFLPNLMARWDERKLGK